MHYIYDQRKFKNFFLSSAQNCFPVALFLNILATHGVETIHFLRLALVCSSFLHFRYLWVHFLTLLRTWNYYSFIGSSSEFDLSYLKKLLFVVWVWFSMRIFDGTFLKIPVITGECDLYSASMEGLLAIKNQLCDPKHQQASPFVIRYFIGKIILDIKVSAAKNPLQITAYVVTSALI